LIVIAPCEFRVRVDGRGHHRPTRGGRLPRRVPPGQQQKPAQAAAPRGHARDGDGAKLARALARWPGIVSLFALWRMLRERGVTALVTPSLDFVSGLELGSLVGSGTSPAEFPEPTSAERAAAALARERTIRATSSS
jgi:hypothetical protein